MTARTHRLTECDTAADVVHQLIRAAVLGSDSATIGRALQALGLRPSDIEAAVERHTARRGQPMPPFSRLPMVPSGAAPAGRTRGSRPAKPTSYVAVTGYVGQLDGEPATMTCRACGQHLPVEQFIRTQHGQPRADGTLRYRRKQRCRACTNGTARARYLTVRRADGLAAVGVEFVAGDDGLACACCGLPIERGQRGVGVGVALHAACVDQYHTDGQHPDLVAELRGLLDGQPGQGSPG